jgi:hypothetical protein
MGKYTNGMDGTFETKTDYEGVGPWIERVNLERALLLWVRPEYDGEEIKRGRKNAQRQWVEKRATFKLKCRNTVVESIGGVKK